MGTERRHEARQEQEEDGARWRVLQATANESLPLPTCSFVVRFGCALTIDGSSENRLAKIVLDCAAAARRKEEGKGEKGGEQAHTARRGRGAWGEVCRGGWGWGGEGTASSSCIRRLLSPFKSRSRPPSGAAG